MHARLRALDSKTVERVLTVLGFSAERQRHGHAQWMKLAGDRRFRVTVDDDRRSFPRKTLLSMIRQSGHSEKERVQALDQLS